MDKWMSELNFLLPWSAFKYSFRCGSQRVTCFWCGAEGWHKETTIIRGGQFWSTYSMPPPPQHHVSCPTPSHMITMLWCYGEPCLTDWSIADNLDCNCGQNLFLHIATCKSHAKNTPALDLGLERVPIISFNKFHFSQPSYLRPPPPPPC